jgi:uncharacterized protein YxjI
MPASVFTHPTYTVRRKIFKLVGAAFHIYDPNGNVAFYSKQKAFKLKEDIRVYTGEDMQTEILTIKAKNIIDFSMDMNNLLDRRLGIAAAILLCAIEGKQG